MGNAVEIAGFIPRLNSVPLEGRLGKNNSGFGLEIREYGRGDPLH
jgi:hypothetical protein